jgi:hypothetical protein
MGHRVRLLELVHPWLEAIGADPDEVRALVADIGAPYPARLAGDPVVLAGRKSGVSIHLRRLPHGGYHVDRISAVPGTAAWPAELVAGETRAAVHARLGAPRSAGAAADNWSLDGGKDLVVRHDGDEVTGVSLGFAD